MSTLSFTRAVHILVVDDDATNRVVTTKLCELFGGTSECADCGQQAVYLVATGAFDIVLMDVRMAQMSGIEAAATIRALPGPSGRVPIVAVSGDVGIESEAACLLVGMNVIVEKPIRVQKLYDAMTVALLATFRQHEECGGAVSAGAGRA